MQHPAPPLSGDAHGRTGRAVGHARPAPGASPALGRRLSWLAALWAAGGAACAAAPATPDAPLLGSASTTQLRRTLSGASRPGGDMDWIEVTLLDRRLVVEEEAERTRRMGHPDDEALRRGEAAWERLSAESGGGPVLEVWMETTCDRCLDLRNWTATLSAPGAARPLPPRWVQSEVMRRTQEVRQVLDASRRLTRSWVRAHLAFDLTSSGRAPLEDFVLDLRRPERWAEPVTLRRRAGGPGWGERLCAAWDAVAAGAP